MKNSTLLKPIYRSQLKSLLKWVKVLAVDGPIMVFIKRIQLFLKWEKPLKH